MIQAKADKVTAPRTLVSADDTVPPRVDFNNRVATDKWWGFVYFLSYVAFLSTGFYVVSQATVRYDRDENGVRTISENFIEEAQACCANYADAAGYYGYGVCSYLNNDGNDRRLQAGSSKFDGDEGIFDAFLEAPEIIFGLVGLTLGIALTWVVALRFFAKPIVFLVEACKIAIFIVIGIYQEDTTTKIFCFLLAAASLGYAVWARKQIIFAAKIITHSTIAMKENPSIFFAGLIIKLVFAGNAGLFVYFFAESFNVVEVVNTGFSCDFTSPSYVSRIDVYLGLSYLWTILLLDKMRLSVIAGVVGSWHFHPNNKPSIFTMLRNIAPSFGTLTISALISSIAEYVNKMAGQDALSSWISPTICITFPLQIFMCCFGACLKTLVQMFTKFAVILHVFTGENFVGSAKSVFNILSRHFKGGFVTEVTSRSVLTLGSYAFSLAVAMVSWKWIDDRFDCGTLAGAGSSSYILILYILIIMFNVWYPILGLYIMIIANKYLQEFERGQLELGAGNTNYLWIPVLASTFVACIAMLMFQFLSNIFLDTIDTLFLCFAIDKDNNVDMDNDEFTSLMSEMPGYEPADYFEDDAEGGKGATVDATAPVADATVPATAIAVPIGSKY